MLKKDKAHPLKTNLEFHIDPFFRQTRAMFDEGTARGLLFNNLAINSSVMLSLDSDSL